MGIFILRALPHRGSEARRRRSRPHIPWPAMGAYHAVGKPRWKSDARWRRCTFHGSTYVNFQSKVGSGRVADYGLCGIERGQGLNNAIKDASDIVDAIVAATAGEISLAEAIGAYEAEMKPRGVREVALSLEQALKARDKDTMKDSPLFKLGFGRGQTEAEAGTLAKVSTAETDSVANSV